MVEDQRETGLPRRTVQLACEATIKAIRALPPSQWMQWIQYILEGLDEGSNEYEELLSNLYADIDIRVREGGW